MIEINDEYGNIRLGPISIGWINANELEFGLFSFSIGNWSIEFGDYDKDGSLVQVVQWDDADIDRTVPLVTKR